MDTVNRFGLLALGICGLAAIYAQLRGLQTPNVTDGFHQAAASPALTPWFRRGGMPGDPVAVLCAGTPVLVLCGGIVSSLIITPNFTDRNLLVTSPFLWGFFAWLYDAGPERWRSWPRLAVTSALAIVVLIMATVVTQRALPRNENFRDAATWIKTLPACRGVDIPVFSSQRTSPNHHDFEDLTSKIAYDRYLIDFASPRVVDVDPAIPRPLPADLRGEVQRRIDGFGCPVIGWASHDFDPQQLDGLPSKMLDLADRTSAASRVSVKKFQYYTYGPRPHLKPSETIVIFMNRDQSR